MVAILTVCTWEPLSAGATIVAEDKFGLYRVTLLLYSSYFATRKHEKTSFVHRSKMSLTLLIQEKELG